MRKNRQRQESWDRQMAGQRQESWDRQRTSWDRQMGGGRDYSVESGLAPQQPRFRNTRLERTHSKSAQVKTVYF